MQRQRVPSLDTTNPVGWFARFIAIASTLGCGLAFSDESIPKMDTNLLYDKIDAEQTVAASSTQYGTQRVRRLDPATVLSVYDYTMVGLHCGIW